MYDYAGVQSHMMQETGLPCKDYLLLTVGEIWSLSWLTQPVDSS